MEKGILAQFHQLLGVDFRPHACEIIAYSVENWMHLHAKGGDYGFKNAKEPQIRYIHEPRSFACILWEEAGSTDTGGSIGNC